MPKRRKSANMKQLLTQSTYRNQPPKKEHPIGQSVQIGQRIKLSPTTIIQDFVKIGNDVIIGKKTEIGEKTIIADNVQIAANVIIGHSVILHKGVIIKKGAIIRNNCTIEHDVTIFENQEIIAGLTISLKHTTHSNTHLIPIVGWARPRVDLEWVAMRTIIIDVKLVIDYKPRGDHFTVRYHQEDRIAEITINKEDLNQLLTAQCLNMDIHTPKAKELLHVL